MYFSSPKKNYSVTFPITLANEPLTVTDNYKYLGITLDSHLTYKPHISTLTKKVNQKLYIFNQIRPFLTLSVSAIYLHAIILSTISYCLPIWSLTTKEAIEPIARLYHRAYKIHLKLPFWTHHCLALSSANALNFQNYTAFLAIKLYFQLQNNLFPPTVCNLLPKHTTIRQERMTRSITNAQNPLPHYSNNYGQRSFFHTNTKIWNSIPLPLRTSTSLSQFKHLYKQLLTQDQSCIH